MGGDTKKKSHSTEESQRDQSQKLLERTTYVVFEFLFFFPILREIFFNRFAVVDDLRLTVHICKFAQKRKWTFCKSQTSSFLKYEKLSTRG